MAKGRTATVDFWQNPHDVYRTYLRRGQTLVAMLQAPPPTQLLLWRPETATVAEGRAAARRDLASRARAGDGEKRLRFTAPTDGWYYLDVEQAAPGAAAYTLSVDKEQAR